MVPMGKTILMTGTTPWISHFSIPRNGMTNTSFWEIRGEHLLFPVFHREVNIYRGMMNKILYTMKKHVSILRTVLCVISVCSSLFLVPLVSSDGFFEHTGKIIYVDQRNVYGPWDGTWEHPFRYIQEG